METPPSPATTTTDRRNLPPPPEMGAGEPVLERENEDGDDQNKETIETKETHKDLEKGEMGFQEQQPPRDMHMSRMQRLSATNPLRLVIDNATRVPPTHIPNRGGPTATATHQQPPPPPPTATHHPSPPPPSANPRSIPPLSPSPLQPTVHLPLKGWIGFIILLSLLTSPSMAEIKSLKIQSDYRPMILFEKFGFTRTGVASIAISSVSVTSAMSELDPSHLGFFLLTEESLIQVLIEYQENPDFCVVDSKFISLLFTFRELSPPPDSSFNQSYPIKYPNEYSLFFANCNPDSLVTMDVTTELYNTDENNKRDYLSAGLTQLPFLYFIFSLSYLCFLGFWIAECVKHKLSVFM